MLPVELAQLRGEGSAGGRRREQSLFGGVERNGRTRSTKYVASDALRARQMQNTLR